MYKITSLSGELVTYLICIVDEIAAEYRVIIQDL